VIPPSSVGEGGPIVHAPGGKKASYSIEQSILLKLTLALIASAAVFALPAAYGSLSKPPSGAVAGKLLRQMNSSPDGRITKSVSCVPTGHKRFDCDLQSVVSTHLQVHVTTAGGSFRTVWEPLAG